MIANIHPSPEMLANGAKRSGTKIMLFVDQFEELYTLVQAELRRSGFEELLSSGIVLTGGSSVMQGMVELGEEIFHMPVRLGVPRYAGGLSDVIRSPRYSTAVTWRVNPPIDCF
jgi:cell division ATPase FtsA